MRIPASRPSDASPIGLRRSADGAGERGRARRAARNAHQRAARRERLTFGRVGYTYKILDQKLFEGLYAGVSLEAGRMEKSLVPGNNAGWLKSSTLFVGMDTIVGPLYVGYGWAADGNRSAYLYLGRP